jgi:hypothetical protein
MLQSIAEQFSIEGGFQEGRPYGSGHIHDTYLVVVRQDRASRFILQCINDFIFPEPAELMENVLRVTLHLYEKIKAAGTDDQERSCLRVVPAKDGKPFVVDEKGKYWRAFRFIEGARSYDTADTRGVAFEAAAAFGRFQKLVADLPGGRLHEMIPGFHDTEKRFRSLEEAAERDAAGRAKSCRDELAFAKERRALASAVTELVRTGRVPERITHNDTKLDNVLFDSRTRKALCVVDLDTVMRGTVLNDFGDMVRTSVSPAPEDGTDLEKVFVREPVFEELARGYLSEARGFINETEAKSLVLSGKLITFEQGIRFLTDYLNGDTYYKVKHARHNLDRCRNQFTLVRSIEENERALGRIIEGIPE